MNASHSTNLFTNSCNHIPTNGKAPPHSHINLLHPTISLFADEGLTLEISKSFTVVIQPLSTRLIQANLRVHWVLRYERISSPSLICRWNKRLFAVWLLSNCKLGQAKICVVRSHFSNPNSNARFLQPRSQNKPWNRGWNLSSPNVTSGCVSRREQVMTPPRYNVPDMTPPTTEIYRPQTWVKNLSVMRLRFKDLTKVTLNENNSWTYNVAL